MPELPEVETVCAGLRPVMEGARLTRVEQRRPNLRFAFPEQFVECLTGAQILSLSRRAKYMLADLDNGLVLVMHLGMSGRFFIEKQANANNAFHHKLNHLPRHDHVVFHLTGPAGSALVTYNDVRRFGFMDLVPAVDLQTSRHFTGMGPEPLGNSFSGAVLTEALRGRAMPIKQALLDQRIVAGLGNIYVCEALFRAGISPRRKAASVAGKRAERLVPIIRDVLTEAIKVGGSTLRDYAGTDGELGYFQHHFTVYGREGQACEACGGLIKRLVQSGRSTFYCAMCQR